jgi:hypothetical protein
VKVKRESSSESEVSNPNSPKSVSVGHAHFDDDVAIAFVKCPKDLSSFNHFDVYSSNLTDKG